MSTFRANTLANVAGTGSPDIVGGELSRARWNLNGTGTIAARDSFNVSSFVDNSTGNYTANFAVAAPNADYAVVAGARISGTVVIAWPAMDSSSTSQATVAVSSVTTTPIAIDATYVNTTVHGDRP